MALVVFSQDKLGCGPEAEFVTGKARVGRRYKGEGHRTVQVHTASKVPREEFEQGGGCQVLRLAGFLSVRRGQVKVDSFRPVRDDEVANDDHAATSELSDLVIECLHYAANV